MQSNQFDTTWTLNAATLTSGQTGYDGSSDAWLLQDTASTDEHRVRQTPSQYNVQTLSVYAKANTLDFLWLRGVNSGSNVRAFFNLSSGTLGTSSGTLIDYNIESVGSGWYRCSMTLDQQTGFEYYIGVTNADGSASYTGTGSGSIYIQDAQLEQGLVATDYIETTTTTAVSGITEDLPRLDYSGGASCPSLLLEPQRTNIIDQSEYFGAWTFGSGITLTHNHATSPEGIQNATLLARTTSGNVQQSKSITSGSTYAISVFAKTGTSSIVKIISTGLFDVSDTTFDLSDQSITTTLGSVVDADIEDYGNGWYRCWITQTAASTGTGQVRINTGDNVNILLYGAQLEAGSYPTSYIPTYGSSVTRSADSCEKTGISSLIGQTEGTLFAEFEIGVDFAHFFLYTNTSNAIYIQTRIGDSWRAYVINGGVYEVIIVSGSVPTSGFVKMAFAYKENDFVLYANGSLIQADTSGSVPVCDSYDLGLGPYGAGLAAKRTKQTILFPTRLSNTELAALTTI